jgi:hypothetical protein
MVVMVEGQTTAWGEYNARYFKKKKEIYSSFYGEIRDTSEERTIWHVIDTCKKKRYIVLESFESCIIYHYRDKILVKFDKFDVELAYMYLYWKAIAGGYDVMSLELMYSDYSEFLSLDVVEDIKSISTISENKLTLALRLDKIQDHASLINFKVVYEDKRSFYDTDTETILR